MTLSISTFILGPIENNSYLIADEESGKAAIIDPASPSNDLLQEIKNNNWKIEFLLITHAHFDHISGVKWCHRQFGKELSITLHLSDLNLWREGGGSKDFGFDFNAGDEPNLIVKDNQILNLGETRIKVLHTPGHTPGHVTYSIVKEQVAFCGDLIFFHGIGRTDLKVSNEIDLLSSIKEKIFSLDPKTTLYPGHGPATTVIEEIDNNPYL